MKIKINIECDTIGELHHHLKKLNADVIRHADKRKLDPLKDEFSVEDAESLYDNNCYGTHVVEILSCEDQDNEPLDISLSRNEHYGLLSLLENSNDTGNSEWDGIANSVIEKLKVAKEEA